MKLFLKNKQHTSRNRGMGLVEIIVGSSLVVIGLLTTIQVYNYYLHIALTNTQNIKASYLLEETLEVVRLLRDDGYTKNIASLNTATSYYIQYNSSTHKWATTTSNVFVDSTFERKIDAALVYRDSNSRIATTSQSLTLDPNTRLITATVSWLDGTATTSKTISMYITNIFTN